jgi:hypothetical protein
MEHFDKVGVVWDDSNVPPCQLEMLADTLARAQKPCIVMVHENLDPTVQYQHIIKNHEQIRQIITKKIANNKFENGPAAATSPISLLGLFKYEKLTGTGFAQPNKKPAFVISNKRGRSILPIGSI